MAAACSFFDKWMNGGAYEYPENYNLLVTRVGTNLAGDDRKHKPSQIYSFNIIRSTTISLTQSISITI